MKKYLYFIFVLLLISPRLFAQAYMKPWSEGKLTWQDFNERNDAQGIAAMNYYLGYETEKQKFGDTLVTRMVAKAFFNRVTSWVNPAYKSEELLRYHQILFDIVELYRRKLQIELDAGNIADLKNLLHEIQTECDLEVEKVKDEMGGGADLHDLDLWENSVLEKLVFNPAYAIPPVRLSRLGYDVHAELGWNVFSGSLGEHMKPVAGFQFGFDFSYQRSFLCMDVGLGFGETKKSYGGNSAIENGEKSTLGQVAFSYGYALIDGNRIRLIPYAGLALTKHSYRKNGKREEDLVLDDSNIRVGLTADFKLKSKVVITADNAYSAGEKQNHRLTARLYLSRVNYAPDLKGNLVNLSLGYCLGGIWLRR